MEWDDNAIFFSFVYVYIDTRRLRNPSPLFFGYNYSRKFFEIVGESYVIWMEKGRVKVPRHASNLTNDEWFRCIKYTFMNENLRCDTIS